MKPRGLAVNMLQTDKHNHVPHVLFFLFVQFPLRMSNDSSAGWLDFRQSGKHQKGIGKGRRDMHRRMEEERLVEERKRKEGKKGRGKKT